MRRSDDHEARVLEVGFGRASRADRLLALGVTLARLALIDRAYAHVAYLDEGHEVRVVWAVPAAP